MQYFLIVFVAAVFCAAIIRIQLRRRRTEPIRQEIQSESVAYRVPVDVKYWASSGWSLKTLANMELVVRTDAAQVILNMPTVGGFLGSEWYFRSADTRIEMSESISTVGRSLPWIVLATTEMGKDVKIAIRAKDDWRSAWNALVATGMQPRPSE